MSRGRECGRTLRYSVRGRPEVVRILQRNCISSAGPNPSISGMRRHFWGMNALVIRAGAYAYYMGPDMYAK